MKASDYIVNALRENGIQFVFHLSGGMITHLLDSLCVQGDPAIISMRHEQSAAFAADAVGRLSGIPGVAMATSGPGATNLLTGIGSCYFDSTPSVFITGQVNTDEQRGTRPIRQLGFQETDIVGMARPVTKAAWPVKTAGELPGRLREAFRLAVSGRPGPVLIDIPMNVQRSDIIIGAEAAIPRPEPKASGGANDVPWTEIRRALSGARKPLILAGGGIRTGLATPSFVRFIDRMRIPVVNSLMGTDVLPFAHPLRVGFIGTYGNRWANKALWESDFLLVLGSRLDVRQTGARTNEFKAGKPIFHVDCDSGEINNRIQGCAGIEQNLRDFLGPAAEELHGAVAREVDGWCEVIQGWRRRWPDESESNARTGLNPNRFIRALSEFGQKSAVFVTDVGQHQMWAAQSLRLTEGQRFLTCGGMGAMGFGLPAAIGAAFHGGGKMVTVVSGDGGMQCNIQELETVKQNVLPVKMIVMDNRCHGMVRQFQENYFEGRYPGTVWGYSAPQFERIANAYGIGGRRISEEEELIDGLRWLYEDTTSPALLVVEIDPLANAYPKVGFGGRLTDMEPVVDN